jgi:hypothetical protein
MWVCRRILSASICLSAFLLVLIAPSCRSPEPPSTSGPPPEVYRDEVRFGLTFEERMAIPAELSRLKAEANRRADEMYDPFRSRESAVRNEETASKLFTEARGELLAKHDLNEAQLDEIIREYQASQGANIR